MSLEEKCTESSQIILQWINATESLLLSEDVKLTDLNVMKQQLKRLQESVDAVKGHERSLEQIDSSSEVSSPEICSVDELKSRFLEVKILLDERVHQVQSCKTYYLELLSPFGSK